MKKLKLILAALVLICGLGVSQTSGDVLTLPFHEPFNMREEATEDPGWADDPYADPNVYVTAKELWNFYNADSKTETFKFDFICDADATGNEVRYVTGNTLAGDLYFYMKGGQEVDDWLIMKKPVEIENTCYVEFWTRSSRSGLPAEFPVEVLYSSTPDDMESWIPAGEVMVSTTLSTDPDVWKKYYSDNLDVAKGEYYIAFRINFPNDGNDVFFRFDEVHIYPSRNVAQADIALTNVSVPSPNCSLPSDYELSMDVENVGPCRVKDIAYMVQVKRDGDLVTTVFDTLEGIDLAAGAKTTIYPENHPVDFSVVGSYEVTAYVNLFDTEDYKADTALTDNAMTVKTWNEDPRKLPVLFDFVYDQDAKKWWSHPDDPNAWRTYTNGWEAVRDYEGVPLISTCVEFEKAGTYVFRWCLSAGQQPLDPSKYVSRESYKIYMGGLDAGTDMSDWTLIKSEYDVVVTPSDFHDKEMFRFDVETPGTYRFAIVNTTKDESQDYVKNFNFSSIEITEPAPDYRVNSLTSNILEYRVPKKHLSWTYPMVVDVTNEGTGVPSASVRLEVNGNKVGESETFTIPEGESKNIKIDCRFPENLVSTLALETNVDIVATLVSDEDAYEENNERSYRILVSDTVMSIDNTDGLRSGASAYFGQIASIGRLFTLVNPDTVTGISVAYIGAKTAGTAPYGLKLCAVDTATKKVSPIVYFEKKNLVRAQADEEVLIPVNPVILPAGNYVIIATQETAAGALMMVSDYKFVNRNKTVAFTNDGSSYVEFPELGNMWMRPIFGHNAKNVSQIDLTVSSIERPLAIGSFSANEPVKATVTNLGVEKVENVTVYCDVDGKVTTSSIASMEPLSKVGVEIEADLSAIGFHTVKVYVSVEGDLNKGNDTATVSVECQAAQDPYFLDFESCPDFALEGFNPAWKSVDKDGASSWMFPAWNYVRPEGPFAFMAFNSGNDETLNSILPAYDGKKMGLSISPSNKDAVGDDWLVSPQLSLVNGAYIEFYVRQNTEVGGVISGTNSEYEVYVSTESDDVDGMLEGEYLVNGIVNDGSGDWQYVNVDLSEYAGKNVYIGIRFISYSDSYVSMIDNIKVSGTDVANEGGAAGYLIRMYPNPAQEYVTLRSDHSIDQVRIFSSNGQSVYQNQGIGSGEYRINVEKFVPGIYFVKIVTDKGASVQKLVIE